MDELTNRISDIYIYIYIYIYMYIYIYGIISVNVTCKDFFKVDVGR